MELAFLRPEEVPVSLAALRAVALANGSVTTAERDLLELVAGMHRAEVDLDKLPSGDPSAVAEVVTDPHRRKRLVQMAVVTAMVDGDVTPEQERTVRKLADALEIDEGSLRVLHDVVNDSQLLTRVHLTRRLMGPFAAEAREKEGLAGVRKLMAPIFGGGQDAAVAWRYKRLGLLPQGTLGRAFWEHNTSRQFSFPGEPNGIPERMVFHDFGHVLAGYDTDAEGEIQQGAFQAGFIRNDGFSFLLFVIVQFHMGIKVTPVAAPRSGLFDVRKVLRAAQRGAACKEDLSTWDHWKWVEMPVEEVRHRFGIPPLAA
jgi:hypothetical protein